jgi:hypothetical protein
MLLCCAASLAAASSSRAAALPVGTWNCLVYGPYGDQRLFIGIAEDRKTYIARIRDASLRRWNPISDWRVSRGRIRFTDPAAGREFVAETGQAALGGTWRAETAVGGWWCSPEQGAPASADSRPPSPAGLMTELVPAIMASPNYPRQAIREAKQGRAVSCFIVNGIGEVSDAELMELSDEIFRGPTLTAVTQSRYRAWGDEQALRPACRSYTFELDAIR